MIETAIAIPIRRSIFLGETRNVLFSIGFNTPTLVEDSLRVYRPRRVVDDSLSVVIPAEAGIQNLDASVRWHDKYLAACSEGYLFRLRSEFFATTPGPSARKRRTGRAFPSSMRRGLRGGA
jgi:hypothetical protein